jgi:hypothetical protein
MSHDLTIEARDRVAKAMAEAANGGAWADDYTEAQRDLWRVRVDAGMFIRGLAAKGRASAGAAKI